MKSILLAIRNFFHRGNKNIIKVLSLGLGLAVGIILISKVFFESSYENFYPDNDRIYIIASTIERGEEGKKDEGEFNQVSGAIALGFQDYVPGIEFATRITWLGVGEDYIFTEDMKKYSASMICADTNYFKVLPRPVIAGDLVKALSQPWHCAVSRSTAEKLGGVEEAMGKTIFRDGILNAPIVIDAVFEDIPENSVVKYDIYISMETYRKESRENWVGNDRYRAYVKVTPDMDPYGPQTAAAIRKMQEDNQPLEELRESGLELGYILKPFNEIHSGNTNIRNMNIVLSLIAFILIFTALMNYILIVISTLISKGKEVAIRKCYGAEGNNIRGIMFAEALINIIVSLAVAVVLIFAFRGKIEELIGASFSSVFSMQALLISAGVCIVVFFISGFIPAYIFEKVPVSSVFRGYKETKRRWKLVLLSVQIIASAILISLLIVIIRQYNMMTNDDPGYNYDNLLVCSVSGAKVDNIHGAIAELKALPQVMGVETAQYTVPVWYASGNNIFLPGDERELFNIADLYGYSEGYWKMMGIKIVEGNEPKLPNDVIVSKSFVDKMNNYTDWSEGAVGKQIIITEHSQSSTDYFTISGVYNDIKIGSIADPDIRPSIMFLDDKYVSIVLVKLKYFDSESIAMVQQVVEKNIPNKSVSVASYAEEMQALYQGAQQVRDSVFVGGIITLLIALIGLIGYTNDEILRRSREIAIRKVNGAVPSEIYELFSKNMLYISIPSIIAGCVVSYFIASKWIEQFSQKIPLSPWIFILSALCLLAVILIVVFLRAFRISRENPVKAIGRE
jgi:putative ABC transport system permease protein